MQNEAALHALDIVALSTINTQSSYLAHARYPVRCGFSAQYWRLWNTGSSACADDEGDGLEPSLRAKRSNPSLVLDPAARSARVMLQSFAPKEIRGRRECRVRAAPAVSCAKVHKENAHEPTGSAEALRHSPRAPRRRIRLVTVDSELMAFPNPVGSACLRQLDTSNGCQDHTASPYAATSFVCAPRSLTSQSSPCNHVHAPDAPRPPHPIPTSVTIAIRPSCGMRRRDF
jgi:hypothetical protein